jgi:hypothetical protein
MTNGKDMEVLGDYAFRGFSTEYPDDHVIVLKYHDEEIAKFSQQGATAEAIQSQCNSHLVEIGEEPFHLNPVEGAEESSEDIQTMRKDLGKE